MAGLAPGHIYSGSAIAHSAFARRSGAGAAGMRVFPARTFSAKIKASEVSSGVRVELKMNRSRAFARP